MVQGRSSAPQEARQGWVPRRSIHHTYQDRRHESVSDALVMSAQPFRRDLRRVQRLRRAFVECLSKNFSTLWYA